MPIRFPTMHIAESVTNRILNVWDDLQAADQPAMTPTPPAAPNTPQGVEIQGAQLDAALSTPPPAGMETPPGVVPPSPGSVAAGVPPIEGIP